MQAKKMKKLRIKGYKKLLNKAKTITGDVCVCNKFQKEIQKIISKTPEETYIRKSFYDNQIDYVKRTFYDKIKKIDPWINDDQ